MRPNFLGIGAGRAGTTTIHDLIKDHLDSINRQVLFLRQPFRFSGEKNI